MQNISNPSYNESAKERIQILNSKTKNAFVQPKDSSFIPPPPPPRLKHIREAEVEVEPEAEAEAEVEPEVVSQSRPHNLSEESIRRKKRIEFLKKHNHLG